MDFRLHINVHFKFFLFLICFLLSSCEDFRSEKVCDRLIIVITFDDGDSSIYENALPIMNTFDFKATNFVNTNRINQAGSLTWEQVDDLEFLHGWETGGHTLDHVNLVDISLEEAEIQIKHDWLNLKERGLSHYSFALPEGHASHENLTQISKYYENIRNSRDKRMYAPVNRKDIGYFFYQTGYSYTDVLERIISAKANRENLVVIGFHRVKENPQHYPDVCSPGDFMKIMDFLTKNKLSVMTIREAIDLLGY